MNYVSYSLWGDNDAYFEGLLRCIHINKSIYPGWQNIVYYDQSIAPSWIKTLRGLNLRLEECRKYNEWDGLFWRFKVFDLVDCKVAIVRDTDSPSTKREQEFVTQWLNSDQPLHIIRDHPAHDMPIMGGMWGFKGRLGINVGRCISNWRWKQLKGTDQDFLRKYIYLKFWKNAFVHTSFNAFQGENVDWIEPSENYIGKPYFSKTPLDLNAPKRIHKRPTYFKVLRGEFYLFRNTIKFKY